MGANTFFVHLLPEESIQLTESLNVSIESVDTDVSIELDTRDAEVVEQGVSADTSIDSNQAEVDQQTVDAEKCDC